MLILAMQTLHTQRLILPTFHSPPCSGLSNWHAVQKRLTESVINFISYNYKERYPERSQCDIHNQIT
jgi:hypothetical protein